MAKQLTINDPTTGVTYTLEYTRKSVEMMEKSGFVAEEVERKPMTMLPALFAGAFLAHHRFVKRDVIDNIYARLTHKDELISALVEMYNEPLLSLLDDPEQQVIAEGTKVDPNRVTVIEERAISCPEAPYIVHFRVWGTDNRTVLVFHKAEDADDWQLVLCQTGSDVTPEFPADGTYAVAATW